MKPKINALLKQITSGKMKTDKARILNLIKTYPKSTLPEIKFKLALKHETASARVSDLLDMGIIEESGTIKTNSGIHSYFSFQPDTSLQEKNAFERQRIKFHYWKNKGSQFKAFMKPELQKALSV